MVAVRAVGVGELLSALTDNPEVLVPQLPRGLQQHPLRTRELIADPGLAALHRLELLIARQHHRRRNPTHTHIMRTAVSHS